MANPSSVMRTMSRISISFQQGDNPGATLCSPSPLATSKMPGNTMDEETGAERARREFEQDQNREGHGLAWRCRSWAEAVGFRRMRAQAAMLFQDALAQGHTRCPQGCERSGTRADGYAGVGQTTRRAYRHGSLIALKAISVERTLRASQADQHDKKAVGATPGRKELRRNISDSPDSEPRR
jgi:hypothetical protein